MKDKIIILLIFSFLNGFGQETISVLKTNEKYDLIKNKSVNKLNIKTTHFTASGKKHYESIVKLNKNNTILSELGEIKKDKLKINISYLYDSTGNRITEKKTEYKHSLIPNRTEFIKYKYDKEGNLISIIYEKDSKRIWKEISIKNNSNGKPIELKIKKRNVYTETINYNFNESTAEISHKKGEKVFSKYKITIFPKEIKQTEYYVNGFWNKTNNEKVVDYKYDNFGNWIKKTIYKISHNAKKEKEEITIRKIEYN
jgi:YD repeat-containing protein